MKEWRTLNHIGVLLQWYLFQILLVCFFLLSFSLKPSFLFFSFLLFSLLSSSLLFSPSLSLQKKLKKKIKLGALIDEGLLGEETPSLLIQWLTDSLTYIGVFLSLSLLFSFSLFSVSFLLLFSLSSLSSLFSYHSLLSLSLSNSL